MTEGMQLSTKTEATPILVSEGTSTNGALQLLAEQYHRRLERIVETLSVRVPSQTVPPQTVLYYTQAEAAVRALYADAT